MQDQPGSVSGFVSTTPSWFSPNWETSASLWDASNIKLTCCDITENTVHSKLTQ